MPKRVCKLDENLRISANFMILGIDIFKSKI